MVEQKSSYTDRYRMVQKVTMWLFTTLIIDLTTLTLLIYTLGDVT